MYWRDGSTTIDKRNFVRMHPCPLLHLAADQLLNKGSMCLVLEPALNRTVLVG